MGSFHRLRERFWFIPALLCLGAFILAEVLIAVDEHLGVVSPPGWARLAFYRVGESGSRDILGAIATSSLAVAGTTFSITMAVLALTSSSYGPRLVRNFMADRGNQAVLGVYVATFLYSLLVLRSIRVPGDPGDQQAEVFVPHLAVNAAVVFALANVGVLIYFIHHISDSIQVSTLARRVRSDLLATVDRLYPAQIGDGGTSTAGLADGTPSAPSGTTLPPGLEAAGAALTVERSGYLQWVDEDEVMDAARKSDVLIVLQVRPGQYVLEGAVVARVVPAQNVDDRLRSVVRSALGVGDARSPHQDIEFAIQQLTEMAVRALSPGTNDPYTAVNALDDLSAGLAALATRPLPSPARHDADGRLRVYAPRLDPAELVTPVLDSMRWYAAGAPSVLHATLELVRRTGTRTPSEPLRQTLAEHVDLLRDAFAAAGHHAHDVRELARHADSVLAELGADTHPSEEHPG